MQEFQPLNKFEASLLARMRNYIPADEFVRVLLSSDLVVPTASEVQGDGSGFTPVTFERNGTSMLALFSAKERALEVKHLAKFCVVMEGYEVLRRMPKAVGIVVNPGLSVGFELTPAGIAEILSEFTNSGQRPISKK